MKLKDKTIVITGGGRGLGRAMALAFAAKGAKLALVGVNEGVVNEAAALCREVDLTVVFLCAREAAAKMIELITPGVILNISSLCRSGNFGQTNYSAAKAGVVAMTVVWAKELARYGIRVAAIAPGFCETRLVTAMKPEALERFKAGIPLKRLGRPEEIAHSALYIFENDYVTGRVLEVDGGMRV